MVNISEFSNNITFDFLVRIFFLVGVVLYIFYAFLVYLQVGILTKSIHAPLNIFLNIIAGLHFVLTVLLLLVAVWQFIV